MTEPTPSLTGLDEEPDLGTSYVLTADGWEPADYQEPARDWRLLEDGSYESPDGLTRTFARSEPVQWADAERPPEH
ncbi:MAG TPA: hypothetical protein VF763_03620 [Candidatus Limnocylindrales bacterium]